MLGDVNVSLIKTVRGRTIVVEHGTNLPRPYSRIHMVQGTKGLFQGYPDRVYIEGRGKADQWQQAADVLAEFEHPLWKEIAERAQGAGHGGMDYIEDYRLIKCLREGLPTDMNVYDAAALSAVVELSIAARTPGAARRSTCRTSRAASGRPIRRSTSCGCERRPMIVTLGSNGADGGRATPGP